jgi:hypothetical protein
VVSQNTFYIPIVIVIMYHLVPTAKSFENGRSIQSVAGVGVGRGKVPPPFPSRLTNNVKFE